MKGLSFSSAVRSERSFHMRYLAKEKVESTTSSTTSKPFMSITALRTMFQMRATSTPDSSSGSLPSRSEEHTSELQSLMRISYAVFRLKKKNKTKLLSQLSYI